MSWTFTFSASTSSAVGWDLSNSAMLLRSVSTWKLRTASHSESGLKFTSTSHTGMPASTVALIASRSSSSSGGRSRCRPLGCGWRRLSRHPGKSAANLLDDVMQRIDRVGQVDVALLLGDDLLPKRVQAVDALQDDVDDVRRGLQLAVTNRAEDAFHGMGQLRHPR